MILFRQGTTDQIMKSVCRGNCQFLGHPNTGGTPFVKVHASEQEVEEMVGRNPDAMEVVEPDEIDYMIPEIEIEADEAMTAAVASWGLERVGVPSRASSGLGVHVYVQDTGIRASHEDFGGRVVPTIDMTSDALWECAKAGDAGCAADRQGHGTHCAGTVGGNTFGVASGTTIHAVKTLSDQGSGMRSWQITAIDWITTSGEKPSVLSMSLGGRGTDPNYAAAIGAATIAGVTVVVAAGNENSDTCNFSPGFVPAAITVGATDSDNERASYSNYGSCNDIMAPGTSILSAYGFGDAGARMMSGTSMACPHVSGAAAILIESGVDSRDDIFASMEATGRTGLIFDLKEDDPDLFLWVGTEPPPPPATTLAPLKCPSFALYATPDIVGDCQCPFGNTCSTDGGATKNCPQAAGVTRWPYRSFIPTCEDCLCYSN